MLRMVVIKQVTVATDFHGIFFDYGSQRLPSPVWLPAFFKNIFYASQKKIIQVWNNMRRNNNSNNNNFHFWVKYPLKIF